MSSKFDASRHRLTPGVTWECSANRKFVVRLFGRNKYVSRVARITSHNQKGPDIVRLFGARQPPAECLLALIKAWTASRKVMDPITGDKYHFVVRFNEKIQLWELTLATSATSTVLSSFMRRKGVLLNSNPETWGSTGREMCEIFAAHQPDEIIRCAHDSEAAATVNTSNGIVEYSALQLQKFAERA